MQLFECENLRVQEFKRSKKGFEKDDINYQIQSNFIVDNKGEEFGSFVIKYYQHYISSILVFIMIKPAYFLKFIDEGIRYGTTLKSIKKESKPVHR